MIKTELGDQAVILETRKVKHGFWLFGRKETLDVLAAVEDKPTPPKPAPPANASTEKLQANLDEIRTLLKPHVDSKRDLLIERLKKSGVEDSLVEILLKSCGSDFSETKLSEEIQKRLPISADIDCVEQIRLALVGPTGVGKTTTIAKLAARFALTERKSVALITMDTYRIGAVEQLKIYARLLNLPLEVAQSPDEMKIAIEKHADKEVILIDTIGRSPQKSLQLAEIQSVLNVAEPTHTYLVLSAPFELEYLFQAAERFSTLKPKGLIITKLDEIGRWGVALSLSDRTRLPVAFITDGQEVPRNLRAAKADEIALHILGGIE